MEQPARNLESAFDPRCDDPAVRRAQRDQLAAFARELQDEHGPVDSELRDEIRAKLASLEP